MRKERELFRVTVLAGGAYETPVGQHMWDKRVRASLKERPGLRPLLKSIAEPHLQVNDARQLVWGVRLAMPNGTITRVLAMFAKGLYYRDAGEPLPQEVEIIGYHSPDPKDLILQEFAGLQRVDIGGTDVVSYWRWVNPENQLHSLIWLVFYRHKAFLVETRPTPETDPLPNIDLS